MKFSQPGFFKDVFVRRVGGGLLTWFGLGHVTHKHGHQDERGEGQGIYIELRKGAKGIGWAGPRNRS